MPPSPIERTSAPSIDQGMPATLVVLWRKRSWSLRLDAWKGMALAIVLPVLATAYLGATIYNVCHDKLLASLMLRQVDMQYAYEDRIAVLKSQLVQDADRAATNSNAFETRLRDLAEKSRRLFSHAAIIDGVVSRLHPAAGAPALPASGPLDRLGDSAGPSADSLSRDFERLDDRQKATLGALVAPMVKSVERLHRVLARTGLPLDRWHLSRDVGGPFVPLADGMQTFERTAALVADATSQQAELVSILSSIPVRHPFAGPLGVTSSFGARLDPFFGRPALHTGVDLREDYGATVTATARGTVTLAGVDGGYGKMVEIDHGHGVKTRYAHLETIAVSVGQSLTAGTPIGQVGSSGRATGPHLHYEVRIDGEPVDPMRFLKAGEDLPQSG